MRQENNKLLKKCTMSGWFSSLKYRRILFLTFVASLIGCSEMGGDIPENRDWKKEILGGLFKKPVSQRDELLYSEVDNLEQLKEASERIAMPASAFFGAYESIGSLGFDMYKSHISRLSYKLDTGDEYEAFSYLEKAKSGRASTAYLIIPGSGVNEAGKIFYGDEDNYHCCLVDQIDKNSDRYVYVKPNNDFLAIHRGGRVLNGKITLYPQLITMGASYSTRYLVDAIAYAKYLKSKYEKVVVMGLSQGGNAALLVSLQSEPDIAIVASGYSVLNAGPVYVAGVNQVMIPGLLSRYTPEYIRVRMSQQKSKYFFSFGRKEKGMYGSESENRNTESAFQQNDNIEFHYHDGGHVFPVQEIFKFLAEQGV